MSLESQTEKIWNQAEPNFCKTFSNSNEWFEI